MLGCIVIPCKALDCFNSLPLLLAFTPPADTLHRLNLPVPRQPTPFSVLHKIHTIDRQSVLQSHVSAALWPSPLAAGMCFNHASTARSSLVDSTLTFICKHLHRHKSACPGILSTLLGTCSLNQHERLTWPLGALPTTALNEPLCRGSFSVLAFSISQHRRAVGRRRDPSEGTSSRNQAVVLLGPTWPVPTTSPVTPAATPTRL